MGWVLRRSQVQVRIRDKLRQLIRTKMKLQILENDLSLNSFLMNFPTLFSIHLFAKEMHENKRKKKKAPSLHSLFQTHYKLTNGIFLANRRRRTTTTKRNPSQMNKKFPKFSYISMLSSLNQINSFLNFH